jgi:hypothetical protein
MYRIAFSTLAKLYVTRMGWELSAGVAFPPLDPVCDWLWPGLAGLLLSLNNPYPKTQIQTQNQTHCSVLGFRELALVSVSNRYRNA